VLDAVNERVVALAGQPLLVQFPHPLPKLLRLLYPHLAAEAGQPPRQVQGRRHFHPQDYPATLQPVNPLGLVDTKVVEVRGVVLRELQHHLLRLADPRAESVADKVHRVEVLGPGQLRGAGLGGDEAVHAEAPRRIAHVAVGNEVELAARFPEAQRRHGPLRHLVVVDRVVADVQKLPLVQGLHEQVDGLPVLGVVALDLRVVQVGPGERRHLHLQRLDGLAELGEDRLEGLADGCVLEPLHRLRRGFTLYAPYLCPTTN